jgi:peptide/nickel transport system permease protein
MSARSLPAVRAFFGNAGTVAGSALVLVVALVALLGPHFAPHDPNAQNLELALKPPFWLAGSKAGYPLGTDDLGRDMLSRILWGSRVATIVGLSVVLIGGTIGVFVGMLAGYAGGWIDAVVARIADIQLAFPLLLLAIAVIGVLGPSLATIIGVLGVTSWVQYVRVVRAETLSLREREFVQSAIATGSGRLRILLRHILPNISSSVIVLATFEVARTIILESGLSFLGLGVQPSIPSWGAMLADGRQYLDTAWWLGTFPGLAIMLTVLGVNLFGDGLRDLLDPRSR